MVTTTSRRKSRSSNHGFTLVELVTSIVILGVLAATAIPRLFDNQSFSERGYADELASALRYAHRIAVASGCEVNFQISELGYTATQRSSIANCASESGAWSTQVRRGNGSLLQGAKPADVGLIVPAAIIFRKDGSLVAAAPPIRVGVFTLSIDQDSGMIRVAP